MNQFQRFVESRQFQLFIITLIILNAVLIGVETSHEIMLEHGTWLRQMNTTFQVLFVIEILLRIGACWPRPGRFFRDGWNLFDFTIVAVAMLPATGSFATVARLARVLRVVRIVSVAPELRLIISTMLRSIPSMLHVILLMALLIYIYAIMGFHMFSKVDPEHWGTLKESLMTTFELLTLDGWIELQNRVIEERPWGWLYFASYIVINVFVVVNLFIAVVLNNLETERRMAERAEADRHPDAELLEDIARMRETIDMLELRLKKRAAGTG